MAFLDTWRTQVNEVLASLTETVTALDEPPFKHALLAAGILWPLRQSVQEFDLDAIEAVNQLLGSRAKYVLRSVQSMADDLSQAARELQAELAQDSELAAAVDTLLAHFEAEQAFTSSAPDSTDVKAAGATSSSPDVSELPPRVFISYARKDAEYLARDLTNRLEQEGIPVWQDRVKMEGGRDWWLQIVDALDQVEFMVLIVTPAAMLSDVVKKEWTYARQRGVCVYPVWGATPVDFKTLPRWLRDSRFYHLDQEWARLVEDLNQSCETPRVPFMAEEVTDDFVPRVAQLAHIERCLLDGQGNPSADIVGLYGTGGYGKTVLGKAVCHDEDIRAAYDDGVVWVTLGQNPGDLTSRVVDLVEVLSGERPCFATVDEAQTRLVQLLADRDILMVLDDVWNVNHLAPFLKGGSHCTRLITTRNVAALPPRTNKIEVADMTTSEAVGLLRAKLPDGSLTAFQHLAQRLGHWPLLIKLTNGTLRDRIYKANQSLDAALNYVNKALDKRGLTAFDIHNAAARDQAVGQTLGLSLERLNQAEYTCFTELVIFPDEVNIPFDVLEKLWQATSGHGDLSVEALCERLSQLSLLAHFEPNIGYITLHKIVRGFLAQAQKSTIAGLHNQFLTALAQGLPHRDNGRPDWAKLPHSETYVWAHLTHHLVGAGRVTELVDTVKDLLYLVTKIHLVGAYAVEGDLLEARRAAPQDSVLIRLHQSISQAGHLLNQCTTLGEIGNTLHSRVAHVLNLEPLATAGETQLPGPLLTAARRLPDLPDASLIRTLAGHGVAVVACSLSAGGEKIVSMGQDAKLKVWDAETGEELHTLSGHKIMGNSCAISANGTVIISATWDGVLKIWDTESGLERFSLKAHAGQIFGCAISADGRTAVTASKDKTLKVWDADMGQERLTLTGHDRAVTGCAISADGTLIASTSSDGTVKLWEGRSGQLRTTLRAYEDLDVHNPMANLTFTTTNSALLRCAMRVDGGLVIASLPDGDIKAWDTRTGSERFTLHGHTGWIESCTISADGRFIISTSNDKTVKGWDAATDEELFSIDGHQRSVTGCAISADGALIVTASQDKTLKLWDTAGSIENAQSATGMSHTSAALCCAVSADGRTVVFDTSGNGLSVIDYESGSERLALKGHMRPITDCAISRDGAIIVSASQDRTLKVWDTETGSERATLIGHMWAVNDCAISPDGKTVVSASDDSTMKVWDAASGSEQFTLTGHMRGVNSCTFSPDGAFVVSASADQTAKVWSIAARREVLTLQGHGGPVHSCAFSPDGTLVASAAYDATVKVWDSQTGDLRLTLEGHTALVFQCAFSPDGRQLLSISKDRTVRLWTIPDGQPITTLRVDGTLADCAWFPDGRQLMAVGARGIYFLALK
ncbi:MAG: TIR domain-containing protein [Anaerolineae bacterium]|nr:TIR domain-containing protein [Anaerolineae bacterium]